MLGVTLHQVRLKNVISQFQTKKMSFDNFEQKKGFPQTIFLNTKSVSSMVYIWSVQMTFPLLQLYVK